MLDRAVWEMLSMTSNASYRRDCPMPAMHIRLLLGSMCSSKKCRRSACMDHQALHLWRSTSRIHA